MPRFNPHEYDVDPETGCWLWAKQLVGGRYGRKWVGGRGILAHVWYYEQAKGPIPEGLEIDHLCRVKQCCNPDHLEAVTRTVNRHRRAHFTEEQVRATRRAGMTATETAAALGISVTAASWIVRRMTWKGIE